MPATWRDWTPWSQCSVTCGDGGTRRKSRSFIPGRYGAELEPDEGNSEETQICSTETIPDWPTCPTPAHEGCWGEWTPCTKTCIEEGLERPETMRIRDCVPENPSTDETLNADLVTCEDLELEKEFKKCEMPICPGKMEII